MSIHKVNYKNFKKENVHFGKTEEATASDASGKKVVYYRIPVQYKYEVQRADGSVGYSLGPLYIQGPREKSRGPVCKEFDKKQRWSVFTKYDLTNEEHFAFVNRDPRLGKPFGTIHNLVIACANLVFERSDEVKINDCANEDEMLRNKFHYPLYWTLGKGALPVSGENPASNWKLFRYGKEGRVNETSFILPIDGGKKIDWSMIEGTQIDHVPVFRVDNITIAGGKPTIKIEMASSVIYDIISSGSAKLQEDTIKEATESDPMLEARMRENIRQLQEARLAKGGPANTSNPAEEKTPSNPVPQIVESNPVPVVIPGMADVEVAIRAQSTAPPTPEKTIELPAAAPISVLPLPAPAKDLNSMLNSGAGMISLPTLPNISLPGL